jgi:flagellar biosynthesis GTPase FlhF
MSAPAEATTSWIFDNVGNTTIDEIAFQIKEAGGEIEGELRKLDKGGIVAVFSNKTAPTAMCKIADWCAISKVRCHLPKSILQGTVRMVIKNLPIDYDADDVVDALREEGLEILELYMFKNSRNQTTGMVKATVKGSTKVKEWLERGRGEIKGARVGVERQRAARACFNCNKIGHLIADCKEAKKCKQCGQEGHLKAECKADAEELANKCSYCFEEEHRRGECKKKREDEREEREKFKQEQKDPVFNNPWKKIAPSNEVKEEEKKESMEEMKEELRKQIKEEMKEIKKEMMKEIMKEMVKEIGSHMREMMKEIMKDVVEMVKKEMMKQQKQQEDQQQQQHQQEQQLKQQNSLSQLKRKMNTPGEQKGGRKKSEQAAGGGKNLTEELFGADTDEEMEGDGEGKDKGEGKKGSGGKKSKKK